MPARIRPPVHARVGPVRGVEKCRLLSLHARSSSHSGDEYIVENEAGKTQGRANYAMMLLTSSLSALTVARMLLFGLGYDTRSSTSIDGRSCAPQSIPLCILWYYGSAFRVDSVGQVALWCRGMTHQTDSRWLGVAMVNEGQMDV
jgi:hypothetical protein